MAGLDCEQHRIAVKRAEAARDAGKVQYDFNQSQLRNAQKLSTTRSISREELDKRLSESRSTKAELDRLEAELAAAQLSESKCEIKAPFNAVVIERIASVGEYVVPGTPIVRILDDENIEISAKVQEEDLQSLTGAADIQFLSREHHYPVEVRAVLSLMDSRLQSYEVRLTLSGEKPSPGSTGRLRWPGGQGYVPADLILERGEQLGIFVLDGEHVRFVPLKEAKLGHPAAVDLDQTTRVVVEGRFNLHDGDPVRVQ